VLILGFILLAPREARATTVNDNNEPTTATATATTEPSVVTAV
jgi:hypothetical protein